MTYCSQLIETNFESIDFHGLVSIAIGKLEKFQSRYLPVLDQGQYMGMVSEDDLLDAEPTEEISSLQRFFIKPLVRTGDHFMLALRVRVKFGIDSVPVVNEKNELEGIIGIENMLDHITQMTGAADIGSMLVLEISRHDYALGEINRLVESNDAMIMHLNTIADSNSDHIQVVLRINKEEVSDIVATFQRHEYHVLYYYGEESYGNTLQANLDHLFTYLNV
jgi:CBS domain-containing protein